MLANLAVTILALLVFLFLFWKRLKEDYAAEIIFKAATYILVGIGIAWVASAKFFPAWLFWASLAGGLIGLGFAILRFRVKFYETLEAFIISSLPWLGLIFLMDSVTHSSLSSFSAFLAILILVFVTYYFDTHYKGYAWYKSGKIGFAGLAIAVIFFLLRTLLAIAKVTMLSFVGRGEAIISAMMASISLILLFNLGRVKE
jgi:hypothetical protein